MGSLDSIFIKEFRKTCQQRAAETGALNINDIPVPDVLTTQIIPQFRRMGKVIINGIKEQYYEGLNGKIAYLWVKPNLKRRQFDRFGKFKQTENGKYIYDAVALPQHCAAIISDISIKVPLAFKADGYDYVDFIKIGNRTFYIYILPRSVCYKLNEVAMVLSVNRLRSFYSAIELKLQCGHTIYLSVVPYTPSRAEASGYRVLSLGLKRDFSEEWQRLYADWVEKNILYPRELTELSDYSTGVSNVAYRELDATLTEYKKYDPSKSLDITGNDDIDESAYEFDNLVSNSEGDKISSSTPKRRV